MRLLEDHLSPEELVSLPGSLDVLSRGVDNELLLFGHLQRCEACTRLAETYWELRGVGAGSPAVLPGCPSESEWLEVAAGLKGEEALPLVGHAARCRKCAADLREAIQLMRNATVESDQFRATTEPLLSSTTEWQTRMAGEMMKAAKGPEPLKRSLVQFWKRPVMRFAFAAVVLLAAGLASVQLWQVVYPSDARLLARAYNKQRTIVLRVPGGAPVPMATFTLGKPNNFVPSSELLELQLRAQQSLDKDPNSPYWHRVRGQVELLEVDGQAARRDFEIAQAGDARLVGLDADLAAAWFEIGDSDQRAEAYAQAAELYSRALELNFADASLLLYNRALCWERQHLNQNALADLRLALTKERSPDWQKAIQDEINRISTHSSGNDADNYEGNLADATKEQLPRWNDSPQAREAILRVSEQGLRHHDAWLHDWAGENHSARSADADRHLTNSIAYAATGDAAQSLDEAREATMAYQDLGNRPGLLRATLAELFAYQRLGNAANCLETAHRLETGLGKDDYSKIRTQWLMNRGDCEGRAGDFDGARRDFASAASISYDADLPLAHAGAVSAQAEAMHYVGLLSESWQLQVAGLDDCWRANCPPGIQYPFIYDMATAADEIGQSHVAAELMKTALRVSEDLPSVTTRAFAVETYAVLAGHNGEYDESARSFERALALLQSPELKNKNSLYEALWRADQAEIEIRRGNSQSALGLLSDSVAIVDSDYQPGRVSYFDRLAQAQKQLSLTDDALANAMKAVGEAEQALKSLSSSFEIAHWARENLNVYADLVDVHLRRGENTAALRTWERFRSAPYGRIQLDTGRTPRQDPDRTQLIVIAPIRDKYVGWLVGGNSFDEAQQTVVLGDREPLRRDAATFYHLCAEKNSRLADIKGVGRRLYDALLFPFDGQLTGRSHLWLDVDPSLGMIPFAALSGRTSNWLGDSTQISILPAWWSITGNSSIEEPSITSELRLVVLNGFSDDQPEARAIRSLFGGSSLVSGTGLTIPVLVSTLNSAEIFHFTGHAVSDSGSGLVLSQAKGQRSIAFAHELLGSTRMRQCRLAVLAACNTAGSDPDRIEQLPDVREAFLEAGARAVIASNWDVDDRATRALMLAFYRRLVGSAGPVRALQMAGQEIRSVPEWQHPYYWASFEVFKG